MKELNMHHVEIVEMDEEGNIQAGMDFWHVPGSDIYLYQEWEHRCAGNEFRQTLPDPVMKDPKGVSDLLYTVETCWLTQVDMVFKNPNYPVDKDYR